MHASDAMRGSVRIDVLQYTEGVEPEDEDGEDYSGIRTAAVEHRRDVLLSVQSASREAVLSELIDGDVREILVLEHTVVDIYAGEDNRDVVEVRGFRHVAGNGYERCRLVFSPGTP